MARKQVEEPAKVRLSFNQSLKAPNAAELLKRLKALHQELAEIDQDAIDTTSLDNIAKELINNTLLLHKERGVKAFLAACLVDILRLYAPEAPYTELELRDVFQFLIGQLKYVGDPTSPHAAQYFYVLESLANVKSIVIVCDLEQGEEMMTDIFKQSFEVISSSTSKNVELNIADMLVQLLDEAATVPSPVVDVLLAQFLPKNVKLRPSAFNLVKEVCQASADKLQRHVVQYFAEIITQTLEGDRMSGDEDEDDEGETAKGKKAKRANKTTLPTDFVVAHTLIRQISRSVPDLLLSVVPLLEKELEQEQVEYRKLATETLVGMCSEKIGQGDVAKRYPHVWRSLLRRSLDVSPVVRLALIEGLSKVWQEHQELSKDIESAIDRLLHDGDEKVRLAAAKIFEDLDFETAYHHVSSNMLKLVGERCKDRKASVRLAAMMALGRLYSLAYPDIESNDVRVKEHFGWIPSALLDTLGLGTDLASQNLIRFNLDQVLTKYILPLPDKDDDETQWTDRFMVVYCSLSPEHQVKLLAHSRISERRPSWWDSFVNCCEKYQASPSTDEAVKTQLDSALVTSASRLPDMEKAKDALQKIVKSNDKQLYKSLKALMDPLVEARGIVKWQRDALRRVEQMSASTVDCMTAFISSSSYLYLNRTSISPLMKRLSTAKEGGEREAFTVLTFIAKHRPAMYTAHSAELTRAVGDTSSDQLAQVALYAAANLLRKDKSSHFSPDKKLSDRAKHYAREGDAKQAKYAATILALDQTRPTASAEVISDLAASLSSADDIALPATLAALARFARHDKAHFEAQAEDITRDVLEILHRPLNHAETSDDVEVTWFDSEDLPAQTFARELCLKVLTNHCIAYAAAGDDEAANTIAKPVFDLLWKLMVQFEEDSIFNAPVAARLRLSAALCVLKLATFSSFERELSRNFLLLARTVQDPSYEVRAGYVHRLLSYLRSGRIVAPRYNMLLFLVAHDPEDELRLEVESYVRLTASRLAPQLRVPKWEHPLLRLIHMLAHHPDFAPDVVHDDLKELETAAKYVQWYLEILATKDNISYLLHLSQMVKTFRDRVDSAYDRNVYTMGELTQYLITQLAKANSWPLEAYPGTVKFPLDIFERIKDARALKQVLSKSFIPTELVSRIQFDKSTMASAAAAKASAVAQRAKAAAVKEEKPSGGAAASRKRGSPSTKAGRPRKVSKTKRAAGAKSTKKADRWDPNAQSDGEEDVLSSPSDSDVDDGEEEGQDENKPVKTKTKGSPLPPAKKGTRTGLRNGSSKANGADSSPQSSAAKKAATTKSTKGGKKGKLAAPRKMNVRDNELESMPSDESDSAMSE